MRFLPSLCFSNSLHLHVIFPVRFADYKERVIDLLQRVCTVSVETMAVVDGMAHWDGNQLVISNDRETNELAELSVSQWFDEPEDPEWEAAWSET
jgi:hypothetical protein